MKVLSVFGTRPEAIKLAPVIKELALHAPDIEIRVCVTGQHREMLNQVLDCFEIRPDHHLDLMRPSQSPLWLAGSILLKLEAIMSAERPDWVLVQGDTTSTAAGAMAGFYAGARVAHVEAGLRTYDLAQPFPEEGNRRITGSIASLHLAPTVRARNNLLAEGVPPERIVVTGNPVVDALRMAAERGIGQAPQEFYKLRSNIRLLLVTIHRRENFGRPLESLCAAIEQIARRYQDSLHIMFPVHLNPNVWSTVHQALGRLKAVTLIPPLEYIAFIGLLRRCHLVMTDSGGVQEEASSLGKPVLVLRNTTERPEVIEAGCGRLVGTRSEDIVTETARLLDDPNAYEQASRRIDAYGDGRAATRIVAALWKAQSSFGGIGMEELHEF